MEELTDLLKVELEKYDMIDCEYVVEEYLKQGWVASDYKKTLVVKLKED